MQKRVLILIDGSNFYFKLKDSGYHDLLSFDFPAFTQLVAHKDTIIGTRYYVGKVRQDGTKKSDRLLANQQKLFAHLKRSAIRYVLGYLLKNGGTYHEKGVDVNIAVDIVTAAYEDTCDRIVLVSSDTDLGPAIKKAREKGMAVEYLGFSHMPSVAMMKFCSSYRLLTKKEIGELVN